MKLRLNEIAVLGLIAAYTITTSYLEITMSRQTQRINELCNLCNQLTMENADLKIKIKEAEGP